MIIKSVLKLQNSTVMGWKLKHLALIMKLINSVPSISIGTKSVVMFESQQISEEQFYLLWHEIFILLSTYTFKVYKA